MRRFRSYLQHHFNPAHVYCRLREFGITSLTARRVSTIYERYVYNTLPLGRHS